LSQGSDCKADTGEYEAADYIMRAPL
jgi:hypothetical protein